MRSARGDFIEFPGIIKEGKIIISFVKVEGYVSIRRIDTEEFLFFSRIFLEF